MSMKWLLFNGIDEMVYFRKITDEMAYFEKPRVGVAPALGLVS